MYFKCRRLCIYITVADSRWDIASNWGCNHLQHLQIGSYFVKKKKKGMHQHEYAEAISPQTLYFSSASAAAAAGFWQCEAGTMFVVSGTENSRHSSRTIHRERLAKFLAPSAFISINVSFGEPNKHTLRVKRRGLWFNCGPFHTHADINKLSTMRSMRDCRDTNHDSLWIITGQNQSNWPRYPDF